MLDFYPLCTHTLRLQSKKNQQSPRMVYIKKVAKLLTTDERKKIDVQCKVLFNHVTQYYFPLVRRLAAVWR